MTYQEILQSVGYPTDVLVLDFESYFDKDYSLKKMSTIEYITDSRFELQGLGMGFYGEGEDDSVHFITPSEIPICLSNRSWDNYTVVVQNAFFDTTILKEKFGIVPKFIIDIKDLSKHWDARESHRLKDLAKHFKLKAKGDTLQFSGLRWETMRPDQREDYIAYTKNDIEIEWELFKILLPFLTNPETELKLARHTLDLYLNPRIKFNAEKAKDLQADMIVEELHAVQLSGHTEKELRGNKSFVEILNAALPENELIPMKRGKNGDIPALAKDDEGLKYLLAHPEEAVRNLVKARQAVKSWPLHIKRIENLIKQAAASGGYLRIPLNYYGGHTGRWGGTEKINPQNFGAAGRAGKGTHELIAEVRELLESPEGFKFSITDSAQIEARILAWLAGQEDLINGFTNNQDIYSEFASRLFGSEVRKPSKTDPPDAGKILTIRRGFGKDAILGCGFGMGGKKFYDRCIQNIDLRPLFDSGEYDYNFIDNLIKTYRTTYSRIPEFWSLVERCFKQVIKFPHQPIGIFYEGVNLGIAQEDLTKCLLTFWNNSGTVNLQLPSGRVLYYRHCRLDNEGGIRWQWGNLWGGSITENIVQSVARDLLGYWILEFEKRSLPVVLHAHDEIVALISGDTRGNTRHAIANNIMCRGPAWAEGLPLSAEGAISDVYKK
jgi:DNA polymerase bacteriophage-type